MLLDIKRSFALLFLQELVAVRAVKFVNPTKFYIHLDRADKSQSMSGGFLWKCKKHEMFPSSGVFVDKNQFHGNEKSQITIRLIMLRPIKQFLNISVVILHVSGLLEEFVSGLEERFY